MVLELLTTVVTTIIEWCKQIYQVANDTVTKLIEYVKTLMFVFPPDDPKKSLYLSVLFFFLVLALILVFSTTSWSSAGVVGQKTVDMKLGEMGNSNISANSGGQNTTTDNTLPALLTGQCNTDQDCQANDAEDIQVDTGICCYSDQYENYSCSGACQYISGLSRDDCKHPNSCYYYPHSLEGWLNHAKTKGGRCDVNLDGTPKSNPNAYCREATSGSTGVINAGSICCNSDIDRVTSPCYGYCLTNAQSNCNDPTACAYENLITTVAVSATMGGTT